MRNSIALTVLAAATLGLAVHFAAAASAPAAAPAGSFPDHWIDGTDCGSEPEFQVHRYDRDTFLIRQSKCVTYEAPFQFLLLGEQRALLLDTGGAASSNVARAVQGVIQRWLAETGKTSIPLIVAHSHSHSDHVQGDAQFAGQPGVLAVVGTSPAEVQQFFGFQDYPNDVPTLELGGRTLDVIGIPGHQAAHIALYDRRTELLLTGDTVYPGHLFVFELPNWPVFVESLGRLADFARSHPVRWVLGCHIEMSDQPGGLFPYGTPAHPNEHVLQLPPEVLEEAFRGASAMGAAPQCKVFDDFALHPFFSCGLSWSG